MSPFLARLVTRALLLAALSSVLSPTRAQAQIKASELQSIAQTVDGTTVRVTYSRPRMRGRYPIFGTKRVQWGEVWTPGANWATLLEVNKDLTIAGTKVPKGKYGVWMVVDRSASWTMLLDPKWKQYHTDHPKPNDTQIRVAVRADSNAVREEVLTWSFPAITVRGGTLAMHWANMRVTTDFTVEPSISELLPEAEARPYLGTFELTNGKTGKVDAKMIVTYARGGLKAQFDPKDDYLQTFALMRTGPQVFTVGLYESAEVYAGGEIYEVLKPDMMFTFKVVGGVLTLECRGEDDELYFTGKKLP
ncbi:DUF2911 domain-containing protein [Gemmatimonas sp.]|uniref:DUF2911 domain-containing protein n=1 Tax=Gemmatimonas sp. TaxID=1962908 RepID=UPI00286C83EB|nr:DUF2911 domain-containing protein [Gemmatimonas sp.]